MISPSESPSHHAKVEFLILAVGFDGEVAAQLDVLDLPAFDPPLDLIPCETLDTLADFLIGSRGVEVSNDVLDLLFGDVHRTLRT